MGLKTEHCIGLDRHSFLSLHLYLLPKSNLSLNISDRFDFWVYAFLSQTLFPIIVPFLLSFSCEVQFNITQGVWAVILLSDVLSRECLRKYSGDEDLFGLNRYFGRKENINVSWAQVRLSVSVFITWTLEAAMTQREK